MMTISLTREEWIRRRYEYPDTWLTLRGKEMRIEDMDSLHLENCIAMMERADHNYYDCPVLNNMHKELAKRYILEV